MTLKLPPLALLALSAATLGGCQTAPHNRGIESVHQPVVSRSDYVFDARQSGSGLAEGETARVAGWFDSVGLRYGDRVAIDGRGFPSDRVAVEVGEIAGRYGLLMSQTAPPTAGTVPDGHVRIVVSRTTATVPGCPDWRGAGTPDLTGSASPNYGCATASNLAAMVADPEDLVRGRVPNPSVDASASGKAIKTYRDRTPSGSGGALPAAGGAGGGGN